ncbi:hypothetical protein FOA52_015282 [Chlamydomonas sp. UWO 241]|nr:hypothetical protein FOA52_015282 [Chlamydomonas sp. UWO 241]
MYASGPFSLQDSALPNVVLSSAFSHAVNRATDVEAASHFLADLLALTTSEPVNQSIAPTELIAAIDAGTQSTRVYLFNRHQQAVASHQVSLPQIRPQPGWHEHDPYEVWKGVEECMVMALELAAQETLGPVEVTAIGITNQRETTLVWSRTTGQPLSNAIVWMDTRTADICNTLSAELPGGVEHFRAKTGLPISTYLLAYKFKWMYDNVDDVTRAVDSGDACFGAVDSRLMYMLTGGAQGGGVHVTDVSNASRTGLMDLATCEWDPEIMAVFGVTPGCLPRIMSCAEVYGHVAAGPYEGVPISGSIGDQHAAMLGQRCVKGEAENTYGTGAFVLLHTGPHIVPSRHGLLTTVAYRLGPDAATQYALEGSIAVAGRGVSWLMENLGIAAYPKEVVDAQAAGLKKIKMLRADGGASQNDLLMQMQADVLQCTVRRPVFQETTALGAALAAGIGIGMWTEEEVLASHAYGSTDFRPHIRPKRAAERFGKWNRAVERSVQLADLENERDAWGQRALSVHATQS